MRKENLVTRTITTTTYKVMVVNTSTATVETMNIVLSGCKLLGDNALKQVAKRVDNGILKAVAISDSIETSNLYGMSDNEFIEHARIIKEGGR